MTLPKVFEFPLRFFLCASLGFFALKVGKTLWLYAARVKATPGQNLSAALAGLSLTHTIGKAMFSGLFTNGRPFMRTPKCEDQPAFVRGLLASREESTILALLGLGALAICFRYGPTTSRRCSGSRCSACSRCRTSGVVRDVDGQRAARARRHRGQAGGRVRVRDVESRERDRSALKGYYRVR